MGLPEVESRAAHAAPFFGCVRADVSERMVLDLVRAFHEGRLPAGAEQLSDHKGKYASYFVPLPGPPGEALLKHFSHRRLSRIVWPVIGLSKAMHSWRVALHLRHSPPLCSLPIAAIERRSGPFVLDSYFLAEWISSEVSCIETATEYLIGGERTQERILRDLAEFMAALHQRTVFHSGLHAGNILEEPGNPPRLLMIDLDAASFHRPLSEKDRVRMLFDAFEYFLLLCQPADFEQLVAAYGRAAHIPPANLRRHVPHFMERLEEKRRQTGERRTRFRDDRLIKLLTWPLALPARRKVLPEAVSSWDGLLDNLRSRGALCLARRNVDFVRGAAPEGWPQRLEQAAQAEEGETEKALTGLHRFCAAMIASGMRPLLLGTLPLLRDYGHSLGVPVLTPFEIVVRPDEMDKAMALRRQEPNLQVTVSDRVEIVSTQSRLCLPADWLMDHSEDFDLAGLRLATLRPEAGLLYYSARCNAVGVGMHLKVLMDFAVFLDGPAGGADLDEAVEIARGHSAEGWLWTALRRLRHVSLETPSAGAGVLRRIAARPE